MVLVIKVANEKIDPQITQREPEPEPEPCQYRPCGVLFD
jgi:hypothetical protein